MTESELIQKLEKIERLFSGAKTDGERDAAANARERVQGRLNDIAVKETATEYKFSLTDQWSRSLFIALLRRYGISPYRLYRQRRTTVMAKIPKSFLDDTLWPEFSELSKVLHDYISEITNKVIREHIHADASEAEVKDAPKQLES